VANVRQHLASIYEREQNWKEAASVLVGIPLETGQKYLYFAHYVRLLL
jgi:COP9 signalosome complex subunit 4